MKSRLHYYFCGLAVGAADLVPGISGGTIAFVLGIYPRLLNAIEAFNLEFFKHVLRFRLREASTLIPWAFLLPLLVGVGTSIFSLARAVTYVLATYPITIWSFFFGLMVSSILHLGKSLEPYRVTTWLGFVAGAACGWFLGGASVTDIGQSLPTYFISGFIAICAMILPGISGAFILVLLGQYAHVIRAVATLDIPVLVVFAFGCVCGLMTFARVLNRLLAYSPNVVMAVLTGLMLGSLRTIWPWKHENFPVLPPAIDSDVVVGTVLCLLGMALPSGLALLARRK